MKFNDFLKSMLSDAESGGISAKRVWGSVFCIIYISLIYINTYTPFKTPDIFVDGIMYIILGVFVAGTLEYFSKRQPITTVKAGDNTEILVQNPTTTTNTTNTTTNNPGKQPVVTVVENSREQIAEVELVDKQIAE